MKVTDDYLMPFGKYKNKKIGTVPASYLDWLMGQDWLKTKYPMVYKYCKANAEFLEEELRLEDEEHCDIDDILWGDQ